MFDSKIIDIAEDITYYKKIIIVLEQSRSSNL